MTSSAGDQREPHALAFGKWLQAGFSGCRFAASFAGANQLTRLHFSAIELDVLDRSLLDEMDQFLEGCGERQQAGILIFPKICRTEGITSLAKYLQTSGRWRLKVDVSQPHRGVLIALDWRAKCGRWSSAMGFAPLLSMPLTRRAPRVALALWPGDPKEGSKSPGLSFMDMPSGLNAQAHQTMLTQSEEAATAMFGESPKTAPWRKNAFCLDRVHCGGLFDDS